MILHANKNDFASDAKQSPKKPSCPNAPVGHLIKVYINSNSEIASPEDHWLAKTFVF